MILGSGLDSRQYRIAFPIEDLSQVPADFVLPLDCGAFDAGVFLPRDDMDWLGRRRYPARILLLSDREALIVPHPSADEQPVRVPLDLIERIEWGRILLIGWIVLNGDGRVIRLPYNTRARAPVEKCMQTLVDRWLPAPPAREIPFAGAFGEPIDLKFEYARSAELLAGETALAQFFQASPRGDLALVTSRRLLWITERRNGRYERYGTVGNSAGLSSIAGVRWVRTGRRGNLEVAFRSGASWHVPIREDQEEDARGFEAAVRRML
jgi:hypothetical protein